jgi:hypothetical protein
MGIAGSLSNSYILIGTINNPNIPIHGKSLDGNRLDLKAGENLYGLTGMSGLAVRLGKQTELFVDGFYIQPLLKKAFVQFKETNGFFLTRKKANVPWDDQSLYYYHDEHSIGQYQRIQSPLFQEELYYWRLGIRSGF